MFIVRKFALNRSHREQTRFAYSALLRISEEKKFKNCHEISISSRQQISALYVMSYSICDRTTCVCLHIEYNRSTLPIASWSVCAHAFMYVHNIYKVLSGVCACETRRGHSRLKYRRVSERMQNSNWQIRWLWSVFEICILCINVFLLSNILSQWFSERNTIMGGLGYLCGFLFQLIVFTSVIISNLTCWASGVPIVNKHIELFAPAPRALFPRETHLSDFLYFIYSAFHLSAEIPLGTHLQIVYRLP